MANLTNLCFNDDCTDVVETYSKAEIDALLAQKQDVVGTYFRTAGGTTPMITVQPGATITQSIDISIPSGWSFVGYRQISIGNGNTGYNAVNCLIRFFSTIGGGTKAQVSIKNTGSTEAYVEITVTVLLLKTV